MNKPWIVDDAGTLINMETRETYDYVSELVDELNATEKALNKYKEESKTLWEYLSPFHGLARDYNLTYDQLFKITRKAIEKGEEE